MKYKIIKSQIEFVFIFFIFGFLITTRTSLCDTATNAGEKFTKLDNNVAQQPIVLHNDSLVSNSTQKNHKTFQQGQNSTGTKTKKINDEIVAKEINEQLPTTEPVIPVFSPSNINTGALRRASYVFLGLSVLVVAYFMVRSSRLRTSSAQMVRKYGILAHRQDVEMRPLPLDEDDEDDTTVFDISGFSPQKPSQIS